MTSKTKTAGPAEAAPPEPLSDALISRIAAATHGAVREWNRTKGETDQVDWDVTPSDIKRSAIDGVRYALGDAAITPEMSHRRWVDRKLAEGWKRGMIRSHQGKTHPNLVPWNELPPDERVKDALFIAIVRAIADNL